MAKMKLAPLAGPDDYYTFVSTGPFGQGRYLPHSQHVAEVTGRNGGGTPAPTIPGREYVDNAGTRPPPSAILISDKANEGVRYPAAQQETVPGAPTSGRNTTVTPTQPLGSSSDEENEFLRRNIGAVLLR